MVRIKNVAIQTERVFFIDFLLHYDLKKIWSLFKQNKYNQNEILYLSKKKKIGRPLKIEKKFKSVNLMNFSEKKYLSESFFNKFLDFFLSNLKICSNTIYLKNKKKFLLDKNNFQTIFKRKFLNNNFKKMKYFLDKKKLENTDFLNKEIFIKFTKDNKLFNEKFPIFIKNIKIHFYLCYFINKIYEINIFSPSLTIDFDILKGFYSNQKLTPFLIIVLFLSFLSLFLPKEWFLRIYVYFFFILTKMWDNYVFFFQAEKDFETDFGLFDIKNFKFKIENSENFFFKFFFFF